MHPLALVYIFVASCSLVHTMAHVLVGKAFGVEIEEVGLFGGPTIARIRLGGTLWIVNLVPGCGAYVKFRIKGGDEFSKGFDDFHPLSRILIIVSGSLALVVVALACMGLTGGARSVWHGFGQIVRGGVAPVVIGAPLVRSLFRLTRVVPLTTILGIVAAKQAAFNLIPLAPLDGGQIVLILVESRVRISERIVIGIKYVGIIASVILFCGWICALAWVLIQG